jgi:long-chain acyl-CoA synthetase
MSVDTILHRLMENGRVRPEAPAYYVKQGNVWHPATWHEFVVEVRRAARALIALGLEPGRSVCIQGFNRPEWVIFNLASMLAGGHAAGIYSSNSPPEVRYIIDHSEASIILLENIKQWEKFQQVRHQLPGLKHVVMMKESEVDDPLAMSWDAFMARGDEIGDEVIDEQLSRLRVDQLATLIYTSGTTGPPKAVMLTHENLIWTAKQGIMIFDITSSDSVLSYLPLSHIAEQMFTIHTAICAGYQVYFAEFPPQKHLNDNFKEVSPTIVFGVPRVWERFAGAIKTVLARYSGLQATIANWALRIGKQVSTLQNRGDEPNTLLNMQHKIAERLVYSKVKEALGLSNARYCITGAAPIAPEIVEFFCNLNFPMLEIYGQSEVTGPTSVNRVGANRIGSVGQAWPGTQVRLAGDGEILVKGPNVFMGYYKNPTATASDLVDGWLLTGDLGQFDEDGYLTIIGRKKEIIITSGGLNIAPKNIEAALVNLSLISQAVCIGDQRRYITAIVTLNEEARRRLAREYALESEELHAHPLVIETVGRGIEEEVNSQFGRAEQVRDFRILPRDFTLENGELTPTLKIKRKVVMERFSVEIESMYSGE